jgi:ribonuclease H / adenosylcobalamin/alpha-ribazole phosphatase
VRKRGERVRTLILARHGEAASNVGDVVSGIPPGEGLSARGRRQARALGRALAGERVDLGVSSELLRARETLELALAGREVPTTTLASFNEINFGQFEGGPLATYRDWAWTTEPDVECPGGGESRASAAARIADALDYLLARREPTILLIGHALPVRYVLDAADGRFPSARIGEIAHAEPFRLQRDDVDAAAEALRTWSETPRFADEPA